MRYLDGVAEAALKNFRPTLNVSEAEYAELSYRLTTAPARPMLLSSLAGVTLVVLILSAVPSLFPLLGFSTLSPGIVISYGLAILALGVAGPLVYHTMHQFETRESHLRHTGSCQSIRPHSPLFLFWSYFTDGCGLDHLQLPMVCHRT